MDSARTAAAPQTVLCIEDHPVNMQLVEAMLQQPIDFVRERQAHRIARAIVGHAVEQRFGAAVRRVTVQRCVQ